MECPMCGKLMSEFVYGFKCRCGAGKLKQYRKINTNPSVQEWEISE
jgi:hypothetical protein